MTARASSLAVAASVALHLGGVGLLAWLGARAPVPAAPPAPAAAEVTFTRVGLAARQGRGGPQSPVPLAPTPTVAPRRASAASRPPVLAAPAAPPSLEAPAPQGPSTAAEGAPPQGEPGASLVGPAAGPAGSALASAPDDGRAGEGAEGGAGPAVSGGGAQGGGGAPSASLVALVHARLAAAAVRCYPAAARRFSTVGTAGVHFCLDGSAAPLEVRLVSSSGSAALDGAATNCVLEQAAPLPAEAAAHCFEVPVRFGR